MKRKGRKAWKTALLLSVLFLLRPVEGLAEEGDDREPGIEQVYVNLPDVYVYTQGMDPASEGVTASLGDRVLEAESVSEFKETEEGIGYYILLDISDSMPTDYFASVKEGIRQLFARKGEKDQIAVYAFGDEVSCVLTGNETEEELTAALAQLKNDNQTTSLFEAVDYVATEAEKQKDSPVRKVLAVITDGNDFALGKKTEDEALKSLAKEGLPVYALGIRDAKRDHLNKLGEFARNSGGNLRIFTQGEGEQILTDLKASLEASVEIRFKAEHNLASRETELLTLSVGEDSSWEKQIYVGKWIPDTEPPLVLSAETGENQSILICFSEAVAKGTEPESYVVTRKTDQGRKGQTEKEADGEGIPVPVISVTDEGENKYWLMLGEAFQSGEYSIACPGLTDVSMEKNKVREAYSLTVEGTSDPTLAEKWKERMDSVIWRGILLAALAGLLALAIYFFRFRKDYESRQQEMEEEVERQKEAARQKACTGLSIVLTDEKGHVFRLEAKPGESLVGGRSGSCDIKLVDPNVSRKHFMLEWDGEGLWISDLNTTNGTRADGRTVEGKVKLTPKSRISAGSSELEIDWQEKAGVTVSGGV